MGRSLKNIHKLIEDSVSELPIEKSFLNDLTSTIERQAAKESRLPSQTYKPSSLKCIRNMYYQRIGTNVLDNSCSMPLAGICESGTDRHEHIQAAVESMKEYGIDCEYIDVGEYVKNHNLKHLEVIKKSGYETKLYHKDLDLSFLCDGVIKYKGEYIILEIKTEVSFKWQHRDGIAIEHIPQGTAYSTALEIDKVLFLYECRDNCMKKTYMLNVTNDMKTELVSKIETCENYVKKLTPPPKPLEANTTKTKYCKYCKYIKQCNKDGD